MQFTLRYHLLEYKIISWLHVIEVRTYITVKQALFCIPVYAKTHPKLKPKEANVHYLALILS